MKVKHWHWLLAVGLLASLGLELWGERTAPALVWDYPVFFAAMGFFGCLLLSMIAKGVVGPSLDRPEDHYAPEDAENDWTTQSPAAREDALARGAAAPPSGPAAGRASGDPVRDPGEA